MIIAKEEFTSEEVRQVVEQEMVEHLKLDIAGYKCDTRTVVNVLVKAAVERETIESVCGDLEVAVGSNTIRAQLNRVLDERDVRAIEVELNAGLATCIPAALPRRGLQ